MADKRRIVVTGVSRGLGRALAEEFERLGHIVAGCARSADAVRQLTLRFGSPHRFDRVDVSDESQVAAWARLVIGEAGAPDLLLNIAGVIGVNALLCETPPDDFSRIVDVNLKGVFYVIRHFVPAMVERGSGVIVNFSGGWGRSSSPQLGSYCATKWAVEGLTRVLADELPYGLAAVPLDPGLVHTDMLERCLGTRAATYTDPAHWAKKVAPFLLELGPEDNGDPLTAPV